MTKSNEKHKHKWSKWKDLKYQKLGYPIDQYKLCNICSEVRLRKVHYTTIKSYPRSVCDDCGLEANRLTCLQKYGKEPLKKKFDVSTYHKGKCDYCGENKMVTEARDFFYPDFRLLKHDNEKLVEKVFGIATTPVEFPRKLKSLLEELAVTAWEQGNINDLDVDHLIRDIERYYEEALAKERERIVKDIGDFVEGGNDVVKAQKDSGFYLSEIGGLKIIRNDHCKRCGEFAVKGLPHLCRDYY